MWRSLSAYYSCNPIFRHWTTIVSSLFFICFFVCQLIATTFIILAQKRSIARYCYPRLVLIAGLTVCSAMACIVIMCYFGGAQSSMNQFIFRVYEYFFEQIDDRERAELKSELRLYAGGFLALAFTFCVYRYRLCRTSAFNALCDGNQLNYFGAYFIMTCCSHYESE
ncbi:unnamed protein product [Heligmosomoides polygyrus]|uniref:Uncharacterized protein n=1 Tax=Heligmosomoides polygyrus TaxID=6339 RepID=A0A3P8BN09_HELPZ|nr:unnamed protein product [Heligmosomoides polygyrus]